ncbi:MAG TPA: fibronectin type III domain-containing protein, partial [Candidatus Cloacimonadota bacterium]|nr:fibronectin type III domain-containing protein [Candidatus Cloacimonadota bacterium]
CGNTAACAYDNWISHVSEGIALEDYNIYSPWDVQSNNFGDFLIGTEISLSIWNDAFELFTNGFYEAAQSVLTGAGFPYEVVQFTDSQTSRTYYLLRETLNMDYYDDNGTTTPDDDEIGSFDYGWGLFVFNPAASKPIIVTVPHPNDDYTTPVIGYECFRQWDAMFLMINGAGREVKWTEQGTYNNSKSLSDPTRIEDHAYTQAYEKACDYIRLLFGTREFSAQIHSYDWDRHENHANCQVSGGYQVTNPNLPIRDLSDSHNDLINNSNYLILPQNTIGVHPDVFFDDYYAVKYSLYEYYFIDENGTTLSVNNSIDLPGYSGNRQMIYTQDGWNQFDVFEPFFHIEMDELPNCYDQTTANWNWFYGYDNSQQAFNFSDLFTNALAYYLPWIEAMTQTLQHALPPNDNLLPNPPENLVIESQSSTSIVLAWDFTSCYDLYTYAIDYADHPLAGNEYATLDREDFYRLADPRQSTVSIANLALNTEYYFRLRTIDYSGNSSDPSPEISTITAPAFISDFVAVGEDNQAHLFWNAEQQNGNLGFNVYLVDNGLQYLDGWQNNPALAGSTTPNQLYEFACDNLANNVIYTFALSCVNQAGTEYTFTDPALCQTNDIFSLYVENPTGSVRDSIEFGTNAFATDNYDEHFDLPKEFNFLEDYAYISFYEPAWDSSLVELQREIHGEFNHTYSYAFWEIYFISNQIGEELHFYIDPEFIGLNEILYLEDMVTHEILNLSQNDFYYTVDSAEPHLFYLYWGHYVPHASINVAGYHIYQAGTQLDINWLTSPSNLVVYSDIYLYNSTDTLLIAANVPNTVSEFSWQVPDGITMHNACIRLDIHDLSGQILPQYSATKMGIVPSNFTISGEAGWSLVSNPWVSEDFTTINKNSLWGNEAELYTSVSNDEYKATDIFEFGKAYWLNTPNDFDITYALSVESGIITVPLHPGWNLISNPHLCSYNPGSLRFYCGYSLRTYSYAVSHGYISDEIYIYDQGFQTTDQIQPGQSFYIFSYSTTVDSIAFFPYINISNPVAVNTDWQIQITASQTVSDELTLGTATSATAGFDYRLDRPHPPARPDKGGINLFISKQENSNFPYENLRSEYQNSNGTSAEGLLLWAFQLQTSDLSAIDLEFDLTGLPENCYADISLDGHDWQYLV